MSVNKFGAPLHGTANVTATGDNDQRMETIRSLNLYVGNYERENALCLTNDRSSFDGMDAFTTTINTAMDKRLHDLEKSINITMQRRFDHFDDRLVELMAPVV